MPLPDNLMVPNALQDVSLGKGNKLFTRNLSLLHVAVDSQLKGFKHQVKESENHRGHFESLGLIPSDTEATLNLCKDVVPV